MPITCHQVSFSYKGDFAEADRDNAASKQIIASDGSFRALSNIDFTLESGEFLGLAGHTGSGKSTLLQLMAGLLEPTDGTFELDGEIISKRTSLKGLRHTIGFVMQYPERQLFASSVFEDVAFGPQNLGLDEAEVRSRVEEALEAVELDLGQIEKRNPFNLSGGQQRRVALAGILALKPAYLLLDEPLAGLDPHGRKGFCALLDRLHRRGLTMVMSSHSMDDLAKLSDRILVLDHGAQMLLGTPEEVYSREGILESIGLTLPEAQALALKLRACSFSLPRSLYDEETLAADLISELNHPNRFGG